MADSGIDQMLAEYERAQTIGQHLDILIHEITAIVWGANTLLLGFILEVHCKSSNQKLVLAAAVVGIFMSAYVPWNMCCMKIAQKVAYTVCREIESELPLTHKVNIRIHDKYPQWRPGQVAVWVLTFLFVLTWIFVAFHAWDCLLRCA